MLGYKLNRKALAFAGLLALNTAAPGPAWGQEGRPRDWLIIPALGYSSDTGLMGGAAILHFFGCADPGEEDGCRRSSLRLLGLYTSRRQIIAKLGGEHYGAGLKQELSWSLGYEKFPTTFYGIGRDSPDAAAEDFTPRTFGFEASYRRRLAVAWSLGLELDLGDAKLLETEAGGLLAPGTLPGSAPHRYAGAGLRLQSDTRDSTWFPRRGHLVSAAATFYRDALGSDLEWERYGVDLRHYHSLNGLRGRPVLALQLLATHAAGTVPFAKLPALGGEDELRGYPGARYRDRSRALLQADLRTSRLIGPLGVVLFVAYGDVAPGPDRLDLAAGHLGGGAGLRYLYDPSSGLHLRMDFAVGEDGNSSFAITIGEAF